MLDVSATEGDDCQARRAVCHPVDVADRAVAFERLREQRCRPVLVTVGEKYASHVRLDHGCAANITTFLGKCQRVTVAAIGALWITEAAVRPGEVRQGEDQPARLADLSEQAGGFLEVDPRLFCVAASFGDVRRSEGSSGARG